MKPSEFKTAANMTPEESERAREDALTWASEGYATWKYDICQRCGERYGLENPTCPNAPDHGVSPAERWKRAVEQESERQMEEVQA